MWWDLQANGIYREILRHEINARIGGKECDAGWKCGLRFFYPARSQWDAANTLDPPNDTAVASSGIVPPASGIPGPDVLDVRGLQPRRRRRRRSGTSPMGGDYLPDVGSNNWAVAGRLTATGIGPRRSDMHLGQRVPTLWYHARLRTTRQRFRAGGGSDWRHACPEHLSWSRDPTVTSPGDSPTATATGSTSRWCPAPRSATPRSRRRRDHSLEHARPRRSASKARSRSW